ncbi:MAG: methionyl-tRNA formyltransferase [Rhodanobacteraceae bacterium]|nr:MAG: methionyl-tRNA formyltransferase [Rhodanobacteraceae bacterium]
MRLVFAGTPEFALPGLRACLAADAGVVAVYTQPDRPAGRGRKLAPSPVKQAAQTAGIPVEQPESLKTPDAQQRLRKHAPDLIVVIAYGLILPRKVLAVPRLGCWNVHASLLPRWRGAAPIQRAILAGDAETGVCLMQMQAGLDTGPVLLSEATPIRADDTGGTLHDRLAELGSHVLADGLRRVVAGENLHPTPQPETGATYAHKLDKAEARLDFTQPARELERKVRAFDPWPVAEAELAGERVRVWGALALPSPESRVPSPGSVISANKLGVDLACGEGVLRILKLQRAGGRVIGAADYLNARPELKTATASCKP